MSVASEYYVMFRRGVSIHRADCPWVGRPAARFWRGPFTYEDAFEKADHAPATMTYRNRTSDGEVQWACQGDCPEELLLDPERDSGPGWEGIHEGAVPDEAGGAAPFRAGLSVERAADIVSTLNSTDVLSALHGEPPLDGG